MQFSLPSVVMRHIPASLLVLAAMVPAFGQVQPGAAAIAPHVFFRVQLGPAATSPVSGRVLVFVKRGAGDAEVDSQEFHPGDTWIAAKEVQDLAPGASVELNGTDLAYPQSFAALPAGDYEAQAVLDPEHTYNYSGRVAEDWVSPVVSLGHFVAGAGAEPVLTLDGHPAIDPKRAAARAELEGHVKGGEIEKQTFESPVLTKF